MAVLSIAVLSTVVSLMSGGLFPGAAEHPLAQVNERVLMPAGHGLGDLTVI
jgi:hypothetical protein